MAFPDPDPSICVSAKDHDKIVGHSNANYRTETPGKFIELATHNHIENKRWAQMWFEVDKMEQDIAIPFFEKEKKIELSKIAHRCGLAVMPDYTFNNGAGCGINELGHLIKGKVQGLKLIKK